MVSNNSICGGRALRIAVGITALVLLLAGGAGATKSINDNVTGGDCTSIGTWNVASKTCTLTTDLTETIEIDSDGITLDGNGHTITGSSTGDGIYLSGRNGVTIRNTNARNFFYGIILLSSSDNTLSGNNASNNWGGIYLYSSSNNTLLNNTMTANLYNFGLNGGSDSDFNNQIDYSNTVDGKPIYYVKNAKNTVYDSSTNAGTFYCIGCLNVTIKNMKLLKNEAGIFFWNTTISKIQNVNVSNNHGGIVLGDSSNNTLSGNNANSNNYSGIFLGSSSDNTLSGNNANSNNYDGISLGSSSNNTLSGNNASNNNYGIYLSSSSNNTLSGNNANSNNYSGISLGFSSNNTLSGNNANSNKGESIFLGSSSNNTLSGNNANSNNGSISLYSSSDNTLRGNNASNNVEGIFLYSSSDNKLSGNNANSNNGDGITLLSSSNNNTLSGNNASNNVDGIYLVSSSNNTLSGNNVNSNNYDGIYLYNSSNNSIYNNFFNNTNNFGISNSVNRWNITKTGSKNIIGGPYLGGNFWAYPNGTGFSQTCADNNSDGICDSPYTLDSSNTDYLPLTYKFTSIPSTSVSIASQTVTPGSNVTVPIMANNINNVAAYTLSLTYNPTVVVVDSVGGGTLGGVFATINNATGVTLMSGLSLTPQSGNVTLANVVLRAVGTAGQTSPLNLTVTTLSDNNGITIPATVNNGTFTISSIKKGDVNGDGKVDITDALFIAQYTVGLRTLTPTQLAAGDVNCDGKVDITDALFIAQYTVGLRTTFC
jgi:parallel beta-helix repeat protein